MALRGKVVYLSRSHSAYNLNHAHRIAQVGIVQMEMRTSLKMGYTLTKIHRRAADGAVHIIPLVQQELSEERAVLPCDTCYQRYFSFHKNKFYKFYCL